MPRGNRKIVGVQWQVQCAGSGDLEPFDLLRALIGVSHVASGPDWQQSARRLVDILITGLRPIK